MGEELVQVEIKGLDGRRKGIIHNKIHAVIYKSAYSTDT